MEEKYKTPPYISMKIRFGTMSPILDFSKRLYLSCLKSYRAEIQNFSYLHPNLLSGPILRLNGIYLFWHFVLLKREWKAKEGQEGPWGSERPLILLQECIVPRSSSIRYLLLGRLWFWNVWAWNQIVWSVLYYFHYTFLVLLCCNVISYNSYILFFFCSVIYCFSSYFAYTVLSSYELYCFFSKFTVWFWTVSTYHILLF